MRKIIQYTYLLSIFYSQLSAAQSQISPVDQFEVPRSVLTTPYTIETPVQLFILQTPHQNDNSIELGFHMFNINPPNTSEINAWSIATVSLSSYVLINEATELVDVPRSRRNPETGGFEDIENPPQPVFFDIVHDASSVFIRNQNVILENAQSVTPPSRTYPFVTIDLEQAGISPDQKWIGGMLKRRQITDSPAGGGIPVRIPALWSSDGQHVFQVEYPVPFDVFPQNIFLTQSEIKFSPDSHFFIARGMDDWLTIDTPNSYESQRTIPLSGAFMINTETLTEWDVDADVAFTSDSSFFVTLRDGYPSLVSVNSNRVLQRYDIGDTYMLAATFSNDDQTLYIATVKHNPTADGTVYVFPSQLPTSSAECWEVYE